MSEHPLHLPHVASRLFDQPLAIEQSKLHLIASVLAPRLGVTLIGVPDESLRHATVTPARERDERPYQVINSRAVIPVFGTLVQRAGGMDAMSGLTSYEQLKATIEEANADALVTETLLHIDSGGGEATGLVDFLAFLRTAGARKPITAFTDGMAASAAYGIFSAATRRLMTQDAVLGSIGVRMLHVDQTKLNDSRGLVVTEFFAGARKLDFSPHAALTEEKRAALQAIVDAFYDIFTRAVATNLGASQQFITETEAGLFVGQAAVDRRLAHEISTLDHVLTALPSTAALTSARLPRGRRLTNMDDITTAAALEAAYPSLVAEIRTTAADWARAEATTAAATDERTRIQEILELAPTGCEAKAHEIALTTSLSSGDAAKHLLAYQKTRGATALAQQRADAPAPITPAPAEAADQSSAETLMEHAAQRRNEARRARRGQLATIQGGRR